MTTNPYAPPQAMVADPAQSNIETPFFAVSVSKLLILSIFTFGIYEIYWFYKNWHLIKAREHIKISPPLRSIFGIFFCYACFARIRDFPCDTDTRSKLRAGPLALGWILVSLLSALPDPYWLISLFAIVFFIPVQRRVNEINTAVQPEHEPNSRYSAGNWAAIGLGTLWLLLSLVGLFFLSKK